MSIWKVGLVFGFNVGIAYGNEPLFRRIVPPAEQICAVGVQAVFVDDASRDVEVALWVLSLGHRDGQALNFSRSKLGCFEAVHHRLLAKVVREVHVWRAFQPKRRKFTFEDRCFLSPCVPHVSHAFNGLADGEVRHFMVSSGLPHSEAHDNKAGRECKGQLVGGSPFSHCRAFLRSRGGSIGGPSGVPSSSSRQDGCPRLSYVPQPLGSRECLSVFRRLRHAALLAQVGVFAGLGVGAAGIIGAGFLALARGRGLLGIAIIILSGVVWFGVAWAARQVGNCYPLLSNLTSMVFVIVF